ncbi:cocaine esterase [Aplysia californica]|uniref:Carboxylic ester hydrolase n=1 Tax=Aplysia californica TaxID=6500 RepID=A0ABM0JPZ7_APLCA|nr:cocaine esterase [Aplysia californica]
MASAWLLQSLCTTLLTNGNLPAGPGGTNDTFLWANTTYGTLKGKVVFEPSIPVAMFAGIPFAKPPTGALRFKEPESPDSWTGVRDALAFGDECLQRVALNDAFRDPNARHSEDCLYLNVYTPARTDCDTLLPVMVFIHGGGYNSGSGSSYDASYVAAKGVVFVTINYRLDLFGFLSTEDDIMPGNYGMLDQVAALKWVKNNIASFGGDPNMVTIVGQSAGSASVSLLTMSPLAKGLFHRAIMESGSSLSPFAIEYPGNRMTPRIAARLISNAVNCNDLNNSTALLSCLQKVDANTLLKKSLGITGAVQATLINVPRVETTFGFLPDKPTALMFRGQFSHVDTLRGYNSDEFGGFIPALAGPQPITMEVAKQVLRGQTVQFTNLDRVKVLEAMEATFLKDKKTPDAIQRGTLDGVDYFIFGAPMITELDDVVIHAPEKKHYLYQFNYRPSFSKSPPWMSALHGQEMFYLFDVQQKMFTDTGNGPPNADDILVSQQIMERWTNFAKTGNPTSTAQKGGATWNQYSSTNSNCLFINSASSERLLTPTKVVDFYRKVLDTLQEPNPAPASAHAGKLSSIPAWGVILSSIFVILLRR